MKLKYIGTLCIVLTTMFWTASGQTATISSTAMGTIFGDTQTDPQGPTTSDSLYSDVCFNPHPPHDGAEDCAHVRTAVNVDGVMAFDLSATAQVASKSEELEPLAPGAANLVVDVSGSATWSETITNNTGGPRTYFFDFTINPISLIIIDGEGLAETATEPHTSGFSAEVTLNGSQVVFTTSSTLVGGTVSHNLVETGTPIPNTLTTGGLLVQYDFDLFNNSVNLGTLQDGESLTVEYTISVLGSTAFFFSGVAVQLGDPLDLCGDPGALAGLRSDDPLPVVDHAWGAVKNLFR